MQAFLN